MRHKWSLLLVCLLGGAGCITGAAGVMDAPTADPAATKGKPPAPVVAERVTAENAHKQSQALWDELDREVQDGLTAVAVEKKQK